MSKIQLQMIGLDELRAELRRLPEDLAKEAADIVLAHAEAAQRDIVNGYPTGPTGNLKRRVIILKNRALVSTSAVVQSRAPHAWIFEHGTRRRRTDKGYSRGRMPEADPAQQMIPKAIRWRRRMTDALIALVRRFGMQVDEAA